MQCFNHLPRLSLSGEPGTVLLCIGLFQEGTPELVALGGLGKDQLVVVRGQAVIDDDIHPVSIAPELNKGKQKNTLGWLGVGRGKLKRQAERRKDVEVIAS